MASQFLHRVPVLTDGVVRLRRHEPADAPRIVEQSADPESIRWTSVPSPYGMQDARQWLDLLEAAWDTTDGERAWAIETTDADGVTRYAGTVSYRPEGNGGAELAFGLHPSARRRGIMARAIRLVTAHAFEHGIEVMHWRAFVDNWASRRTAWACGFRVEGTVRGLLDSPRGRYDGWVGSLVKGEPMEPAHPWRDPAVLEGSSVRLRPWRETDAPDPENGPDAASLRFMPPGAHPTPEAFTAWLSRARSRMAEGSAVYWCIADRGTDRALGNIQCFGFDSAVTRGSAEVGYWVYPTARGAGIAGEALDLVVGHAFASVDDGGLGLHRLCAGTDSDNAASQRVLLRGGFARTGSERESMAHDDGTYSGGALFELLAPSASPATQTVALQPVTLEGSGIRLREWRGTDAPRVVEACTDPLSRHWLSTLPSPYTEADALAYVGATRMAHAEGRALFWCIADAATDECVGAITVMGLNGPDPTSGEVGYWAHPAARGRGVMTEAVRLAVRHAFVPREDGGLGRRRLELLAAVGNDASLAVARRNRFVEVGRERVAERLGDGTFADRVRFDLLAADYDPGAPLSE